MTRTPAAGMHHSAQLHVLLPTYNRAHRLRQTLDNIFAQTAPSECWHLTVVDNASTDGTRELLEEYCRSKPNFDFVVNERNVGLYGNMDRCLDLARTPKFMIIHSDDEVSPDLVAYALQQVSATEADFYFGPSRARMLETGELIPNWYSSRTFGAAPVLLRGEEFLRALLRAGSNFIFPPTAIYDRAFFAELRYGTEYRWTNDLDLWFRVAWRHPRVCYYPQPLITCGIHSQRLSALHAREMRLEVIRIVAKNLRRAAASTAPVLSRRETAVVAFKLRCFRVVVTLGLVPSFKLRRKIARWLESLTPTTSVSDASEARG